MRQDTDILNFQYKARSYVLSKGRRGPDVDDIVSAMTLEALEYPDKLLALDYMYLHALDTLDPRHRVGTGRRVRDSRRTQSLDLPLQAAEDAPPTVLDQPPGLRQHQARRQRHAAEPWAELLETLPPRGRTRAIRLLIELYGHTQREVAFLFGVHETRISQMLRAGARRAPEPAGDLTVEVRWLTLP